MTNEQLEWLREFSPSHYISEIREEFNKVFNENRTYDSIKNVLRKKGIPKKIRDKNGNLRPNYSIYTEKEKIDWLKENRNNYPSLKLMLIDFNEKFDFNLSYESFKHIIYSHGIKSAKRKDPVNYSEEQKNWVKENYRNYMSQYRFNTKSFINDFCEKFGILLEEYSAKYLIKKILKLEMNFDPKYTYYEYMCETYPLGHERNIHGEWFVKVDNKTLIGRKRRNDRFNYRRKSHILYEQYHNVVVDDKTQIVIQLDDNFDNFGKENLYLISRKAYKIYFGTKYKNECLETKLNALKISEIYALIKEMEENGINN